MDEETLSRSFVRGALIRVPWALVEREEGSFDWSLFHKALRVVERADKRATLALVAGPHTPDWVFDAGAEEFRYVFKNRHGNRKANREERIPLPWDSIFVAKWKRTVGAFGHEFDRHPRVVLVHITGSSKNGFEMQLPQERARSDRGRNGRWYEAGFTLERFNQSWEQIIATFGEAFPTTPLDLEIHPVLGNEEIPAHLLAFGHERIGSRFGAFGAWLSGKSARWTAGLRTLIRRSAKMSFANYQLIGNETRQPNRLAPGGVVQAIRFGMEEGARYFEVWPVDLKNPAFARSFEEIALELEAGSIAHSAQAP